MGGGYPPKLLFIFGKINFLKGGSDGGGRRGEYIRVQKKCLMIGLLGL